MTENALVVQDGALAQQLAGMYNKDDGGGKAAQIPMLKINYDPDCIHPRGSWVVGQTKDQDGNLTDHGKLVDSMVVLTVRNRYSYYDVNDSRAGCSSPFFVQKPGVKVQGSNYKYTCGKSCPYREEGRQPRCKAQIIYFVSAHTTDDKWIECVVYLGGASWMHANKYASHITELRARTPNGNTVELPPFAFLTYLATEKKKNQGITYWEARLTRKPEMFNDPNIFTHFAGLRDGAWEYIENVNAAIEAQIKGEKDENTASPGAESMPNVQVPTVPSDEANQTIDVTPTRSTTTTSPMPNVNVNVQPQSTTSPMPNVNVNVQPQSTPEVGDTSIPPWQLGVQQEDDIPDDIGQGPAVHPEVQAAQPQPQAQSQPQPEAQPQASTNPNDDITAAIQQALGSGPKF